MDDAAGKIPFKEVAERLYQEFVERGYDGEPPESIAPAYLDYVIKCERTRRGATDAGQRRDAVDYKTFQTLKNANSDDPQHAHAMLTFQKLAVNPIKAFEYLERSITDRQIKISRNMSVIASNERPKGRKPFAKIIDAIVNTKPNISRNSLFQELKKHEDISVIDDRIICHEPHDEMPVDALRGALSRSKKRVSKKSKKQSH